MTVEISQVAIWASIASPIIAVIIAVWSGISSRNATAKQLAAIEESTTKQVESIKELARLQMDASIKQVELEIEKNLFLANQAQQEMEGIRNINQSGMAHISAWKEGVTRQWDENKPERDYHLYNKFINDLKVLRQGLESNKKKLN
jgi:ABC-type bacteriocin/lantibiotic exporter with double-glycine peptidase domain